MMQIEETAGLWVRRHKGERGDGPVLLLLHGAGADGEVWNDLVTLLAKVADRLIVPDLPGHGRSGPLYPYGIGNMAAGLSRLFYQGEHICILGHSLGGAIAVAMATNLFGIIVDRIFVIDVKLTWTAEDVAKGRELSSRPARIFEREEAAIDRYLKVSGLHGLIAPDAPAARSGVVADGGGYRLRADPRANAIAGTSVAGLASAMTVPRHLLIGTRDPMMSPEEIRSLDPDGRIVEHCGHNVHVERPDLVAEWVVDLLPTPGGAGA